MERVLTCKCSCVIHLSPGYVRTRCMAFVLGLRARRAKHHFADRQREAQQRRDGVGV